MSTVHAYAAMSATAPLEAFHFESRELRPHDVRLEILYCGVCHSDVHNARNEWGRAHYPMVPGHEIVGRVREVGSAVQRFQVGDLAAVGCMVDACGTCSPCEASEEQFCEQGFTATYNGIDKPTGERTRGGYAQEIIVTENFVLKVPDNLPLAEVAPLLCAGITTYSPLKYAGVGPGHKVAVVGLGGLGHMAVKFAAAFGAEVTLLSTSPSKAKDAEHLGAHHFVLSTDPEAMQALRGSFDFILDTVSARHDHNALLGLLRTNGTLIIVGAPPEPLEIPGFSLITGRKKVMGSFIGGIKETQEMLDYCAAHQVSAEIELIAAHEINTAYERMLKGDVRYRFVIDMASLAAGFLG